MPPRKRTTQEADSGLDEFTEEGQSEQELDGDSIGVADEFSEDDPFAPNPPSIKWDEVGLNVWAQFDVLGIAAKQQARNFKTRKPIRYEDGNYAYDAIMPVLYDGHRYALWARIGGNLFKAIRGLSSDQERSFKRGDVFWIRWTGTDSKSRARQFEGSLTDPTE